MLAYTTIGMPTYYREHYGLQGTDAFDPKTDFNCASDGKFYICRPKRADVQAQVVAMQKAIDAFLTQLPIFRAAEIPLIVNPIGASKTGYDGRVGPVTSGVGEVALIGAAEMMRAAGEGDPPGDVIIAMRDFTAEKQRTENFAKYSPAIATFLNDVSTRFSEIMSKIQARRSAADQPVVVAPPPIPVPEDVKNDVRKGISKGWLIGGGIAAAGLMGMAAWGLRDKGAAGADDRVHWQGKKRSGGADFMGARARRHR